MRAFICLFLLAFVSTASAASDSSKFWIHAEVGPVWQGKNEVQIPADSGTRFSIADLDSSANLAGRVYLGYRINELHELRALYAPLSVTVQGSYDKAISFQGETFQPNVPLEALYTFNSYRLTYRYNFLTNDDWKLYVGGTGKIRDAEVKLTQGTTSGSRTNVGFVPLIHFAGIYNLGPQYRFHIDADFLASPYGRAEDVALLLGYRPSDRLEVLGGYRTVEGGANGENTGNVYSFAWLHYLVAAAAYHF